MYTDFDEYSFRKSVDDALVKVQSILGTTKNPRLAEDDKDHTYDDKYALAEFVSNTSLAAQLTVLEQMGLDKEKLKTVVQWVQEEKQTVTLSFQPKDACSFLKEQEVSVVTSEGEYETTTQTSRNSSILGISLGSRTEKSKHKITQKIKEYHWSVQVSWSLSVYKGNEKTSAIQLQAREASTVIVTSGGQATNWEKQNKPIPPVAETTVHSAVETPLTWIIQQLDPDSMVPQFSIDRNATDCRTPRRNDPVNKFYDYIQSMINEWFVKVDEFFLDRVEREILNKHSPAKVLDPDTLEVGTRCTVVGLPKEPYNHTLVIVREYLVSEDRYRVEPVEASDSVPESMTLKKANLKVDTPVTAPLLRDIADSTDGEVFIPIWPLLEKGSVLQLPDANALIEAHKSSLADVQSQRIQAVFAPREGSKLASQAEGTVFLLYTHWANVLEHTMQGIDYIEHLLHKQLVEAIGKEVCAQDFETFMRFHNQKLFSPEFAPKPFTYAIRRPNHYPDGILAIETGSSSQEQNQSIETMVRRVSGKENPSIFIPINAATSIEMTGDRYLHGWMQHRFESKTSSAPDFRLVARARQFSSFLLIVGTMAGPHKFDPKAAIILQNKDEVVIPLLSNVLPTAQEFKDAIASLSPEQQTFCRAFRAMQLESSVFGVCVIQLKPQLEKLLGLPEGGLTKEIQLTQDLMSLFVEYQIPSDLLSYDGDENADNATKLAAVKGHVKAVIDVINAEKEKQLVEEGRKADMRDEMSNTRRRLQATIAVQLHSGEVSEGLYERSDQLAEQAAVFKKKSKSLSKGGRMMGPSLKGPPSSAATDSLANTKNMIAASKEVGMATLEELERQREVIDSIDSEGGGGDMLVRQKGDSVPTDGEVGLAGDTSQERTGKAKEFSSDTETSSSSSEDFTMVPKLLDAKFAEFDTDNALRSTILSTGPLWNRLRQKNLLVSPSSSTLNKEEIDREKNNAFDLLDALSRSGTLPIACAELHVVIAVSHCFESDVMGTVIQDNVNPIEKVEKSLLMMGSTIYGQGSKALLAADSDARRLTASFPQLFIEN